MNLKTNFRTIWFLLLSLGIVVIPWVHSVETTAVCINPKWGYFFTGESYILNITVTSVTNLSNWQITLSFDPRILNCIGTWVPPDNIFEPYGVIWPGPEIDNTTGRIVCFAALDGTVGVNGSGNLCQIEFQSQALGVSSLNFLDVGTDTYLRDPANSPIQFEAIDGIVEVIAPDLQSNTFYVTQNGETYPVTILSNSTVTSFGFSQTFKEISFNVTGLDSTTGYSSVAVPKKLLNGSLAILIDNAVVCTLSQIFNTLPDNATHSYPYFTYTHSTRNVKIRLTVPGDIDGDRKTDMKDVSTTAKAFGSSPGHPRWNPPADMNRDNKVDGRDITMVAKHFGEGL